VDSVIIEVIKERGEAEKIFASPQALLCTGGLHMKSVCKAARRAVFASVAILLLVMGLAPALMPVSASNGVANASRTISVQSLAPGGVTEVTVTITSLLAEAKSFRLTETLPTGWMVEEVDSDGATFNPSENIWWWPRVEAGEQKTVIYNLTAPAGATVGEYPISGTVTGAGMTNPVSGDKTIIIVSGTGGSATASRTITAQSIMPGGSTAVTVTITSLLGEAKSFRLTETLPTGWTVEEVDSDGATFNPSENIWWWPRVEASEQKIVIYSLTAPAGVAEGTYDVTGTVTADGVSNVVGGDDTVTVATFDVLMYDTEEPFGELSKTEVLDAVLDYFEDPPLLTKAQVIAVLDFYFSP